MNGNELEPESRRPRTHSKGGAGDALAARPPRQDFSREMELMLTVFINPIGASAIAPEDTVLGPTHPQIPS